MTLCNTCENYVPSGITAKGTRVLDSCTVRHIQAPKLVVDEELVCVHWVEKEVSHPPIKLCGMCKNYKLASDYGFFCDKHGRDMYAPNKCSSFDLKEDIAEALRTIGIRKQEREERSNTNIRLIRE